MADGDYPVAAPVAAIETWAAGAGIAVERSAPGMAGYPLPAPGWVIGLVLDDAAGPDGRTVYSGFADALVEGEYGWLHYVEPQEDGRVRVETRTDWLQREVEPFDLWERGTDVPSTDEISRATWGAEGVVASADERPLTPGQALGAAAYDARRAVDEAEAAKLAAESAGGEAKEARTAAVEATEQVAAVSRDVQALRERVDVRLGDVNTALERLEGLVRATAKLIEAQAAAVVEPEPAPADVPPANSGGKRPPKS